MDTFQKGNLADRSDLVKDRKFVPLNGANKSEFSKVRNEKPDYNSLTDEELLDRYYKSDRKEKEILAFFLERYDRYILKILLQFVREPEELEDIKQDIFLKLHTKLIDTIPPNFKKWLGRTIRNHLIDQYIRKKRPEIMEVLPEHPEEIWKEKNLQIDFQIVQSCIEELHLDQQLYIQLRFFRNMKNAAISDLMGWSGNKTRGLRDRALKNLLKCLGGKDGNDELLNYFRDDD